MAWRWRSIAAAHHARPDRGDPRPSRARWPMRHNGVGSLSLSTSPISSHGPVAADRRRALPGEAGMQPGLISGRVSMGVNYAGRGARAARAAAGRRFGDNRSPEAPRCRARARARADPDDAAAVLAGVTVPRGTPAPGRERLDALWPRGDRSGILPRGNGHACPARPLSRSSRVFSSGHATAMTSWRWCGRSASSELMPTAPRRCDLCLVPSRSDGGDAFGRGECVRFRVGGRRRDIILEQILSDAAIRAWKKKLRKNQDSRAF